MVRRPLWPRPRGKDQTKHAREVAREEFKDEVQMLNLQVAIDEPQMDPMHVYTCASSCVWHVHCMYVQVGVLRVVRVAKARPVAPATAEPPPAPSTPGGAEPPAEGDRREQPLLATACAAGFVKLWAPPALPAE